MKEEERATTSYSSIKVHEPRRRRRWRRKEARLHLTATVSQDLSVSRCPRTRTQLVSGSCQNIRNIRKSSRSSSSSSSHLSQGRTSGGGGGLSFSLSKGEPRLQLDGGGGGKLPPPSASRVTFGGDGDGDGGDGQGGNQNSSNPQHYIPVGFASFLAAVLLVSKVLVVWCTNDAETAFMSIDLGFLTFLGWICLFAFRSTPMAVLHPFLIELGSAVILEEMLFSMVLVNKIKPDLNHKWTKDFLVHHVASAIMGWLALYFTLNGRAPGTGFVGVGIIGTEVTTFLPVAFREAVRSKKISKAQVSSVLGVLFPLAFCWRTYWSSKLWVRLLGVGRNYIATKQPNLLNLALWRLGEASVLTVVCSNVVWTCRIAKGSLGVVKKKLTGKKLSQSQFQKEIQ